MHTTKSVQYITVQYIQLNTRYPARCVLCESSCGGTVVGTCTDVVCEIISYVAMHISRIGVNCVIDGHGCRLAGSCVRESVRVVKTQINCVISPTLSTHSHRLNCTALQSNLVHSRTGKLRCRDGAARLGSDQDVYLF